MIPKAVINLAPGMLSIKYGLKGINFGVVNACASGTSAIGEAWWAGPAWPCGCHANRRHRGCGDTAVFRSV